MLSCYQKAQTITLPIAHADGNYYIDKQGLQELESNHQILLKYTDDINGSIANIAGICNAEKNVFGLMPHPERAIEPLLKNTIGLQMLRSIYESTH